MEVRIMSIDNWEYIVWQQTNDLIQHAERIHRNLLQIGVSIRYETSHGRTPCWQPRVNVGETNESAWVILALAGVPEDQIDVRLEGRELVITGERPLPKCCEDGELKLWEIPLGRFERRIGPVSGTHPLSIGEISFQEGLLLIQIKKHL
jgi:HSP20 family molecular chaperone IbpA